MTFEGIKLKIKKAYMKKTAKLRVKKIDNTDFSIISVQLSFYFVFNSL